MVRRYNNLGEQVIRKEKYNNLGQPMFEKPKKRKKKDEFDYFKESGLTPTSYEKIFEELGDSEWKISFYY